MHGREFWIAELFLHVTMYHDLWKYHKIMKGPKFYVFISLMIFVFDNLYDFFLCYLCLFYFIFLRLVYVKLGGVVKTWCWIWALAGSCSLQKKICLDYRMNVRRVCPCRWLGKQTSSHDDGCCTCLFMRLHSLEVLVWRLAWLRDMPNVFPPSWSWRFCLVKRLAKPTGKKKKKRKRKSEHDGNVFNYVAGRKSSFSTVRRVSIA